MGEGKTYYRRIIVFCMEHPVLFEQVVEVGEVVGEHGASFRVLGTSAKDADLGERVDSTNHLPETWSVYVLVSGC